MVETFKTCPRTGTYPHSVIDVDITFPKCCVTQNITDSLTGREGDRERERGIAIICDLF